MVKSFFGGLFLLVVGLIITFFTNLETGLIIPALIGLVLILLAAVLSGALVSGDRFGLIMMKKIQSAGVIGQQIFSWQVFRG